MAIDRERRAARDAAGIDFTGQSDGDARFVLAGPAVLFTLGWLAFAWPWLSGTVTIPWDAKAHFAPQVQFMAQAFARGELPLWNPYAFAGHPQIADPQSMIFSPPMVLLALVNANPSPWAIDVAVFLVLLASGLTVIWLGRELGWHWAAAVIAALAFTFGAAMAWRIQHFGQVFSLAYFPLTWLLLRRAIDRGSLLCGALAGLAASIIVLGRDQVALLVVYVLAIFVVWRIASARQRLPTLSRAAPPLAAGALIGAAIVSLPLLMTLLLAGQSNRPAIDFAGAGAGSLHPAHFVTAVVPHLFGAAGEMAGYWGPPSFTWTGTGLFTAQNVGQMYIGALPLLMLLLAAPAGSLWKGDAGFLLIALGFSVLYALGWFTPAFWAFYHVLPGVDLYRRPADGVFLIGGLAALLAGYAASDVIRGFATTEPSPAIAPAAGALALAFAAAVAMAAAYDRLAAAALPIAIAIVIFALAVAGIAYARWLALIRPLAAGAVLVVATAGDLAFNNGPNGATALPQEAVAMLDPGVRNETIDLLKARVAQHTTDARRERVELVGLGFHWPNASLTHGLEQTLGYNPVRLARYAEATGAGDSSGLPEQRRFTPLFPSYASPLADLLGLRYIATGVPIERVDRSLATDTLPLIARTPDGYVYENPGTLPRVLFAHRAVAAASERLLATGSWPPVDLASTVVLDATLDDRVRGPGAARFRTIGLNEVVIEAASPDGGWVVLHDVWHPWWYAEIDGTPAQVLRANVLFRAVAVPPGVHEIRFRFRPVSGALRDLAGRLP